MSINKKHHFLKNEGNILNDEIIIKEKPQYIWLVFQLSDLLFFNKLDGYAWNIFEIKYKSWLYSQQ